MPDRIIPAPQTGLTTLVAEAEAAQELAAEARAEATRRAYASDWRSFEAWCASRGVPSLPTHPGALGAYLAALDGQGKRPSTIRRAVVAIAGKNRAAGHPSPWGHPTVRDVYHGILRKRGVRPRKKRALLYEMLSTMVRLMPDDLRGTRDRALLLVGWSGAFRREELVSIHVEHVTFEERGMRILVPKSKTDQIGRGFEKGIHAAKTPAMCPVRALRAWLEGTGITTGPVFRAVDRWGKLGESLGPSAVAEIVKHWAEEAGYDPDEIGAHSLRSGFITSARKRGATIESVMRVSGHRDIATILGYSQADDAFDNPTDKF